MSDLVERLRSEAVFQADGLQRVGIDLQANQFMHWEAADEIERLQRELAEARAINANLMGDDESVPRYTTKRLHQEIDRARRQAFEEAAEIIEGMVDDDCFPLSNRHRIAAPLRAKAEQGKETEGQP